MKTLSIVLFALATAVTTLVSTESVTATYDGFENETYQFSDEDGATLEFQGLSSEALGKYDLTDESFKGKTFIITYESETVVDDETEEEITTNIITDLELQE
ncbi:hypothetical protein [Cellulophaga omnivescoria]|uniref:hypothetical protein n=1 Tax=Cellulophaga omnivescoria TaxID=1888890 RepID=UPI000987D44C|nr:hypothetical protein [Cellulophaga omnivescoria]WBU89092.1 hypothetical protein PBN93_14610 [Cellulophaga omnivescoria]WKB81086.1 hypothetical protein QYR09_15195 [Cellulophaga lytica]